MKWVVEAAAHSTRGRRSRNEDMVALAATAVIGCGQTAERTYWIRPDSRSDFARKGLLFAVADGVGGLAHGEQASEVAIQEIAQRYYKDPSPDLALSLRRVIEATNRHLWQTYVPVWGKMGTTVTTAVIHQDQLLVASVGDSRLYLIRQGQASLLTADHDWFESQQRQGNLPDEAVAEGPRNRITRSLGSQPQVGVDIWSTTLQPGDRILLCSDGLSSYLPEPTLAQLATNSDLNQAVIQLVDAAYDAGSRDNITAAVVTVDS